MNPKNLMIEEKIRELAYYKWMTAHCPEGKELEFWLEAELEVLSHEEKDNEVSKMST